MGGGFASVDRPYGNNLKKKLQFGQQLYGEVSAAKGLFDSKIAYTPINATYNIAKNIDLNFTPRFAAHINKNGLDPRFETLTTVSGNINNKTAWYVLFQTYDVKDMKNNIGLNAGLVRVF